MADWPGGRLRIVVRRPHFDDRYVKHGRLVVEDLPIEEVELGQAECVPFADGFALPQPLIDGDPELPGLLIHIGVREGRPCCVGLTSTEAGPPLTTTLLRSDAVPPIGRVVREMVEVETVRVVETVDGEMIGVSALSTPELSPPLDDRNVDIRAALDEAERSHRRWRLTDEHLLEVASIYRDALSQGLPTAATIAAHFKTTEQNARRWVQRARERDFLPETDPRKARA